MQFLNKSEVLIIQHAERTEQKLQSLPEEQGCKIIERQPNKAIKADGTVKACAKNNQERNEKAMTNFKKNRHALSSRIIAAEEANCNRLARELHDCIGQNMTALKLNLNLILQQLSPSLPPAADQRLRQSIDLASETTQKIREIMTALRCKVLDYDGLFAALRWEGNRFAERSGLHVDILGASIVPRLSPEVETALFRIAQEAMTNIFKHAGATTVVISLKESQGVIHLSIADDGKGFIPGHKVQKPDSGWGLIHMQERVEEQNGNLSIISRLGEGTQIIAAVPR